MKEKPSDKGTVLLTIPQGYINIFLRWFFMPRAARKRSKSGIYHILLRGIGQQNLFEEDADKQRFWETMGRYKKKLNFEIHAYCLMNNHVHLLIKEKSETIDRILKGIAGSYAYYYNWKYERTGHLFQDRFKSEAIEDDNYYLTVLRYIHQNPEKAGIEATEKYKWSSYAGYLKEADIVTTDFALDLLGGREKYIQYMLKYNKAVLMDISENTRLIDEKAKEIIRKAARIKQPNEIMKYDIEKRNKVLKQIKDCGVSIRQISRLTGINRGVVFKA